MADPLITARSETRRRLWTIFSVIGGIAVSTAMVANERALFLPVSELSNEDLAKAFGAFTHYTIGRTPASPRARRGYYVPPGSGEPQNPVAFGVRVPNEGNFTPNSDPLQPGTASNLTPAGFTTPPSQNRTVFNPGPTNSIGGPFAQSQVADPGSALPEPSTWLMMILGFGFIGCALRLSRRLKLKGTKTLASDASAYAQLVTFDGDRG